MSSSTSQEQSDAPRTTDGDEARPERAPRGAHAATAVGKEKKRVGFVNDQLAGGAQSRVLDPPRAAEPQASLPSSQDHDDYFSNSDHSEANSLSTTPIGLDVPGNRESFNREELTAALTRILTPDLHPAGLQDQRVASHQHTGADTSGSGGLGGRLKSESEAKDRADRLASALKSSTAGHDSLADEDAGPRRASGAFLGAAFASGHESLGKSSIGRRNGAVPRLRGSAKTQATAQNLVRIHSTRKTVGPVAQEARSVSGTATPVADDVEYVPRPQTYRGGVLGSLLKLYGSDAKPHASSSMPGTPARSPKHSPSSSMPGTPKPDRPRMGIWSGHQRSHSSTTLGELIGSSTIFAAPGSGFKAIPSAVSEKIKHDREQERARKLRSRKSPLFRQEEEYHITVHIAEILSRHKYLIKLCRALMLYGAPTHRLEAYMEMSARMLGIEGQFLYFPGVMIMSFDDSNTHTAEIKLVKVVQGIDLGRLRDVHSIYKDVIHDLISVDDAMDRLNAVMKRKDRFSVWIRVLLYGIASALVAPFAFEGRYIDLPIAFFLGCIVGILQLVLAPSNELYANVFEISAAVITSFLSRAFGSIRGGTLFCFSSLAQSSIAMILPGYMVLCGSLELQNHQMVTGSVRMIYALIYTLFLGYGITIGSIIYGYIDRNAVSNVHCSTAPEWYLHRPGPDYYVLFVFGFTLAMCAINQAKYKQFPVMLFIALAGYLVNNYSSNYFSGNSTLSSSLGALCVGVLANIYSRLGRYVENWWLDVWESHLEPRVRRLSRGWKRQHSQDDIDFTESDSQPAGPTTISDPEASVKQRITRHARKIGYGLSVAAMLPAIFVQVPGGLAVSGSLLSGIDQADQLTRNQTILPNGTVIETTFKSSTDLNATAFNVLLSVIQIAISISVGLSLSALIVYPLGKRRSGLFSL
ncbi:DUF1212-domain-containing protein [Thozetella sp. PMI_491]|nr:DUF1212-domain-containing protein [Thozetella sp. PMI_491]